MKRRIQTTQHIVADNIVAWYARGYQALFEDRREKQDAEAKLPAVRFIRWHMIYATLLIAKSFCQAPYDLESHRARWMIVNAWWLSSTALPRDEARIYAF
jgi:hypothetical protein